MSANDHLSEDQFPRMPMREILALHSIDYPGTVGEMIGNRAAHPAKYPGNRLALRQDMVVHGQRNPILVRGGELHNGGDRVMHAHSLGWKSMAVTKSPGKSDDAGWEDEHYDHQVRPGLKIHPAYASPDDYEAGRVMTEQEQLEAE